LIRQLASGAMPPSGVGQPLTKAEIERIRAWIDEGGFADYVDKGNPLDRAFTEAEAPKITAEDRQSWAFQKPIAKPATRVKAHDLVRSPICAFVIANLEERGQSRSAAASKHTLLRREYYDLCRLPPTHKETYAFLADQRPYAYQRLPDHLLA